MENVYTIQLFLLIALSFLVNFTLLIGATAHVDSWIVIRWLNDKNYAEMKMFYTNVGLPQFYLIFRWLWNLSNNSLLLTGRILFLFRLIHVVLIYQFLRTEIEYGSTLPFLVALFLIIYTGNTFVNDFVVGVQYSLSWTLYLLGIFLIIKSEIFPEKVQYPLIILGFLFVIYSFGMKSLLFVHMFLALILVTSQFTVVDNNSNLNLVVKIFLLFIAFVYWIGVEIFWPRSNVYKDYNKFLLPRDSLKIIKNLFIGVARGLIGPNINATKNVKSPFFGLSFVIFWIISNNFFSSMYESQNGVDINGRSLIILSLILAMVMVFPYALVNQDFDSQGYLTKNFVMLDIAFSFFIIGIIETFVSGNSKIHLYLLMFAILTYSKVTENINLVLQYAKQLVLQQALNKVDRENDSYFKILDSTNFKQKGLKNIYYPMTLYYMSNHSLGEKVSFGEDYTFKDHSIFTPERIRDTYLKQPIPFFKKSYKPETYFEIIILNGTLTVKNMVKFCIQQFGKNPITYKVKIHLFEAKVQKLI